MVATALEDDVVALVDTDAELTGTLLTTDEDDVLTLETTALVVEEVCTVEVTLLEASPGRHCE